jgi:uncharacterized glyoxalase superfamily protein PhnB
MSMTTSVRTEARPRRANPESLRLRSLSAALTAGDLDRSVAWYRDVVGFTLEQTWENAGKVVGASLIAGDVRIHISQDDGVLGRDRVKGQGFRLHMSTVQSVDDIAERIKARGGVLESEPADLPWGTRAFSLVDPDGFKLTISSLG